MRNLNKRFDRKISIYFFSVSMLIVLVLSYVNYSSSVKIIKQNIEKENMQQLRTASIYIASYLEKIKGINSLLAMTPEIISNTGSEESTNNITNIIDLTKSSDKIIKNIMIISNSGKLISNSDSKMKNKNNVLNEKWYKEVLNSNNMAQITTENHTGFTMDKNERVISLSNDILDKSNNFLGLSIIDISYKFIEDYISTVNLGVNGFAFIVDENNNLIFDSKQMNSDSLEYKKEYINIIEGSKSFKNSDYIKSKIYIPNTKWQLVQVRSPEEIYELNKELIREMLLWALLILILSIILSIVISKKITNPIVNLIGEMEKIDDKFSKIKVDNNASIEVKELTREYNLLLKRIKKLTEDIELKEKSKRIYELKALQSQINPHFIYNTLDTILWLVELEENEKAVDVIKSLGTILRNTLSIDEDFIELKRELNHVKNYMDIQKIRYNNKFDYEFEIAANTEDILLPKLIVQPIVENSIYHGIKPKKGKSHIKISSKIEKEDLIVSIEDDGVGFSKKESKSKAKLGGIGMANVDQRIKILYGEEYGLYNIRENGKTKVFFRIKI